MSDIETQAQEVAYLAGVLAGKTTQTGTVGVVVSGEPPTWNYMTVGFAEGLKAAKSDAKMLYSVIGEAAYDDAAGAKRVTEQQLAADADVIFGMGDGASFGMIQAIEEHNAQEGATKAWFIDVIGDKKAEHGDVLLSSVLFDYTGIYKQMLDDLAAGTFGKIYTMDVKNGGVRLLDVGSCPARGCAPRGRSASSCRTGRGRGAEGCPAQAGRASSGAAGSATGRRSKPSTSSARGSCVPREDA